MATLHQAEGGGSRPLGIERLCVFGMPPDRFVALAADLGCQFVGIALTATRYYNPHCYDDWSLRDDLQLRRAMRNALRDCDVGISVCEGFGVAAGINPCDYRGDLDIVRELGGRRVAAVSTDRDFNRTADGFATLAELAAEREMDVVIEIGPGPIGDLKAALAAVAHVGLANFRLLIDTMHFFRFGGQVADLARIDPRLIAYIQLCDAPRNCAFPSYMEEAPLLDLIRVLPPDAVISVEVPQRSLAESGVPPRERVRAVVAATRAMLAQASRGACV